MLDERTEGRNGSVSSNGSGAAAAATLAPVTAATNGAAKAALLHSKIVKAEGVMDPCEAGQLEACAVLRVAEQERSSSFASTSEVCPILCLAAMYMQAVSLVASTCEGSCPAFDCQAPGRCTEVGDV
jgi:hypothetical protein